MTINRATGSPPLPFQAMQCPPADTDRFTPRTNNPMPSVTQTASSLLVAVAALMAIAGHALAQQPTATPNASPERTTATYDDWVVECVTIPGPPQQRVCDMAQVTQAQVQGRSAPFSRVAVAHPEKGKPVRLVVQVPTNASFGTQVHLQTSDSDPGLMAPFARCLPSGCFADFDLKDDALKKLRAATGTGKMTFADAGAHDVSVPVSFKGFDQAFEALSKQ